MTPERWQRVKEVFSAASALPHDERAGYLRDVCPGDTELLAEVESLLAAHMDEEAIVDKPAVAHVAGDFMEVDDDPWLGRRIGAYEIVSLIGRGGMGEVFRARRVDAEYEKEVAIKLVPGGYHAGYVLQRVRAERQILANLEHPNIARLIDGGATDEGSPYLVMELVEGEPLDRYCKQRHLPLRERLELFRDVCAAVTYAHQRLVVHRDLKPSNMLVAADGTVKLLDFGIAKLLQPTVGDTGPAPTIMTALTPGFSSPEQILGKPITTASDVYSLGVVLYGLLTGRSPYRTTLDTAQDAIREVCETEPKRPSEAIDEADGPSEPVDRDLDAIVLRALRKEPENRYASVEQFSEDVRRYLDGLPVTARGDEVGYRTRKFVRRHKLEIAASVLVALTLVGATIVSVREARVAAEQERLAEEQRARAERHFASVRNLANSFMFEVHDAIEELPGSIEARGLLVNTALEYLNTLAEEAGDDQNLKQELAEAYGKVGDIQGGVGQANTGQLQAAHESYGKAISLLEPIVAGDPENTSALKLLADLYLRQGQQQMFLANVPEAIAHSSKALGMLETLVDAEPGSDTQRALARAYLLHAFNLDYAGDAEGVAYARKGVTILEELHEQSPDDLEIAYELSSAYSMVAQTVAGADFTQEATDEAIALHLKAVAIDERLVAATEGRNSTYIRSLFADRNNLTLLLSNAMQDYRGAIEQARAGLALILTAEADPNNVQSKFDVALTSMHLGRSLVGVGEIAEAEAIFERNVSVLEEIAREGDNLQLQFVLAASETGLGNIRTWHANAESDADNRLEQWRLAKSWYEKAIPRYELVMSNVTLDYLDMVIVNDARAGLARATDEIARFDAATR